MGCKRSIDCYVDALVFALNMLVCCAGNSNAHVDCMLEVCVLYVKTVCCNMIPGNFFQILKHFFVVRGVLAEAAKTKVAA